MLINFQYFSQALCHVKPSSEVLPISIAAINTLGKDQNNIWNFISFLLHSGKIAAPPMLDFVLDQLTVERKLKKKITNQNCDDFSELIGENPVTNDWMLVSDWEDKVID